MTRLTLRSMLTVDALLLSGIVRVDDGRLEVRNRVYDRAFDKRWVEKNLPDVAQREGRRAYWSGIRRATVLSMLAGVIVLGIAWQEIRLAKAEAQGSLDLHQMDSFFELSEDLLAIASAEGRFTKLNAKWESVLGYSRAELCSRPYADFVHPEDRHRTGLETTHLRQGMSVLAFTNRYRCLDGHYVKLVWNATTDPKSGIICATARLIPLAPYTAQAVSKGGSLVPLTPIPTQITPPLCDPS